MTHRISPLDAVILHPAGTQVTFPGRPVDLALSKDGKTLFVKNMGDLVFVDTSTAKISGILPMAKKQTRMHWHGNSPCLTTFGGDDEDDE